MEAGRAQSCSTIGWKFYLVFIILGTIGGLTISSFFPDTKGLSLEKVAALFGDEDEIAVYQREIDIHGYEIIDYHAVTKEKQQAYIEDIGTGEVDKNV